LAYSKQHGTEADTGSSSSDKEVPKVGEKLPEHEESKRRKAILGQNQYHEFSELRIVALLARDGFCHSGELEGWLIIWYRNIDVLFDGGHPIHKGRGWHPEDDRDDLRAVMVSQDREWIGVDEVGSGQHQSESSAQEGTFDAYLQPEKN
jgi:hypothetical protein